MKTRMWFLSALFLIVSLCSIYFWGCKQFLTNEPEKSNSVNSELQKTSINNQVLSFEKRRLLLQKFRKEVEEAKIKVKAKWNKTKLFKSNSVMALPPAEQEAMDLANAITPSAYSYVSSAYGVNLYDYYSPGDPNIALTGILVSYVDSDMQGGVYYELDGEPLTSIQSIANVVPEKNLKKTTNIMRKPLWVECMEEATGVGGFIAMMYGGGATALTAMGVIKLAGKIIARNMSWIGAAIALGDFIWCMNRNDA